MGSIGVSSKGTSSGASSVVTSAVTTQTRGSAFVLGATWYNGPASFSSITDNKGNTGNILQIGSEQVGGLQSSRLFYVPNGAGGSGHAWTLNISNTAPVSLFFVELLSGLGDGFELGEHQEGPNDTSSPYVSGNLSLQGIGQMVLAFYADDSVNGTATHTVSGYTMIIEETDALNLLTGCLAYKLAIATGTYNASMTQTGTLNNSTPYIAAWYDGVGNALASNLFPKPKLRY